MILIQPGEILFDKVEVMLEQLNEAKVQIDDMKSMFGGKISIGASVTIGVYVLPKLLGNFIRWRFNAAIGNRKALVALTGFT